MEREDLTESVLKFYPFLREIPENDLALLDLSVVSIPTSSEITLLNKASMKIDKNILVYNRFRESKKKHLCRYIRFAQLSKEEFSQLRDLEKKFSSDKVLVAYEKPLNMT